MITNQKATAEQVMAALSTAGSELLKDLGETTIPLLKVYLKDLRDVRMAIHSEVRDITQSIGTLREISKGTESLIDLGERLQKLNQILTPEFIAKVHKLVDK